VNLRMLLYSCRTLAITVAICALASSAWGQQVTATITGRVTDPSSAAISGAKVTATSVERGIPYTATTNGEGYYNLKNLLVGEYNVKVESAGFQTATQSNITLQMNQVAKMDFQLAVGNVQTTVEVTSAAPVLQTQQTLVGQVIDSRTDATLPLATRNYVELTLLAPGTVHPDLSTFENGFTTGNGGRPYVNGNREQADNFILDGMDNNQVSDNLVGYAPSVDAIQEFNEITQNGPAEFGNFMGAVISTSIKSGTNEYHGDAFEFLRNNVLNSNLWTYNFEGAPKPAQRWNEFGATLGGPIKKDKLFFFIDYQGERFDTPTTISATSMLTAAERGGDFSALLPNTIIYNPYDVTGSGANAQRVPFPNNVIPTNLLSSVASKIAGDTSAYPLPTGPGLVNNFLFASHSDIQSDQGDARVDWNLSNNDRIFGRYSQSQTTNPSTNNVPIFYNSFNNYPTHNGVLDWVHTVSPAIVNDARIGVNYVFINDGAAGNGLTNLNSTVGLPGIPSSILPVMSMSGGYAANIGNSDVYELFADAVIQYEDTVTISKGSHTFHLGFQGWRERIDTFYSGNNGEAGTFTFGGGYTTAVPGQTFGTKNAAGIATGQPEADFMLGLASSIGGGVNGGTWGQRSNVFGTFFQDDWHITPNFTANLGVRWELHTPWCEVHNRQDNFGLFSGQIEYPDQNGNNCALYNQYNGITNFQPRVGLAWNARKNTVVRAAYTLSNYLEGTGTNLRLPINPPFAHETSANYTTSQYLSDSLPPTTLDQGLTPIASSTGFASATLRVWDPNIRPAVANQWNFTIQQQFAGSTTLQVGYVGQRTTHLMVPMPYFQEQLISPGVTAPSPYLAGNPTLTSEISQISGTATNGDQSYNALQAVFQKRLSKGLEYSVAYTYSKCMTNSSGYYGSWGGAAVPTSPYFQNLYDMKAEWGPCYYDVKHTLSSYVTYDLPFGRDRQFGKSMNPVVNAILGDWQANAIVLLHTGFPLTISANDDTGTNSRGSRANCLAPVQNYGKQNSPLGGYQWFNAADFGPETGGTFGTCGVGTVRGPGLATMDASLAKFFNFTERFKLELRAEATNFTNTPILNAPNAGLGSTLGLLQGAAGAYGVFGRQIQFAMKFHY